MRAASLVGIALAGIVATTTVPAAAEEDHGAEERLAYMDRVLARSTAESSRFRTWNAAAGLARGAASIPVGGFILGRDLVGAGFVLVANGALAAGGGLLDLLVYKQPAEELRAHFLARQASGADPSEIVDETEREWNAKANALRKARVHTGVLSLGVGGFLLGVGAMVGFRAVEFPSSTLSGSERATVSSLMIGFGGMHLTSGVRSLLVADPLESGWQSYADARSVWGRANLQVVALRGGAYVGLSAPF